MRTRIFLSNGPRFAALLVALAFTLGLAACGTTDDATTGDLEDAVTDGEDGGTIGDDLGGDDGGDAGGDVGGDLGGDDGGDAGGDVGGDIGDDLGGDDGGDSGATDAGGDSGAADAVTDADTSDDSSNTLLYVLIGAVVVGLIVALASNINSRNQSADQAQSSKNSQLANTMGGFRWIHDQAVVDVLRTSDPQQLTRTWQSTQSRMMSIESEATGVRSQLDPGPADALGSVIQAETSLRAALDSYVTLRTDPSSADRTDLIENSTQTVETRQQDLATAMSDPRLQT